MAMIFYSKTMSRDALVDTVLRMEFGNPPVLCKDVKGKPYLKDCNTYISISHSDEYVVVALADSHIGVDIQRICYREKILSLFAADELVESATLFTRLWTMKESYGKYLGCGLTKEILKTDFSKYMHDELFLYDKKFFCVKEIDDFICTSCTNDDTIHYVCIGG